MNFKPTWIKSSISLIFGILVNYILAGTIRMICSCPPNNHCYCPQPHWIDYAFDPVPLWATLISVTIVYLIWSLFQKK